jgi:predicted RNA-binding protein
MCQATVYLDGEKVMEDVIWLEPTEDGVLLQTFFEEPKKVKGELKSIDLLKHRVLLTSVTPK